MGVHFKHFLECFVIFFFFGGGGRGCKCYKSNNFHLFPNENDQTQNRNGMVMTGVSSSFFFIFKITIPHSSGIIDLYYISEFIVKYVSF